MKQGIGVLYRPGLRFRRAAMAFGLSLAVSACGEAPEQTETFTTATQSVVSEAWRSSLFPENWYPGYEDASGYWLHDYSYAGYRRGEVDPPVGEGSIVANVVDYGADPSGQVDSTAAIQAAITAVEGTGGGVVFLPEGTFRVRPVTGSSALLIRGDGVVLRGAGAGKTFLFNDEENMRNKTVVRVLGQANWFPSEEEYYSGPLGKALREAPLSERHPSYEGTGIFVTEDLLRPTKEIPLESLDGLAVGDWIVVRASATAAFMAEHPDFWSGEANSAGLKGPAFYRQVEAIDAANNIITIDIPTRYFLKVRDAARVYKVGAPVREVGLEGFSIGMRSTTTPGLGALDYEKPGTGGYETHNSHAIRIDRAVDCWIDGVETYRPSVNVGFHHLQSNGILINTSRSVTVRNTVMRAPQYEGAGGNGYMFILENAADSLFKDNFAFSGRHNFSFKKMSAMGNVLFRNTSAHGFLLSDFHMHLSASNLIDSMVMSEDSWSAAPRNAGCCTNHGQTTTQSVFWNLRGYAQEPDQTLVRSEQFGLGYVVGTSGYAHLVSRGPTNPTTTAPRDVLQGLAQGHLLVPQSLFLAQRNLRLPESAPFMTVGDWNKEQVHVFWQPVAGAAGYWVRTRAESDGSVDEIDVGNVLETELSGFDFDDRYLVTVAAYDGNNVAGPESEPVRIAPRIVLTPEADLYVRDGSYAGQNFGGETTLAVKNSGNGFNRITYLRFDVSQFAEPVKSARMRLYTLQVGSSAGLQAVLGVDAAWSESSANWNNRPELSHKLTGFDAPTSAGSWVEVDITPFVNRSIRRDGIASLGILSSLDYGSEGWVFYASKEHSNLDWHPQLVIEQGDVVETNKDTYVNDGPYAGVNYGSSEKLLVKAGGTPGYTRHTYAEFRFNDRTRPVRQAKLRFTVLKSGSSGNHNRVDALLGADSWGENSVSFNNPPPLGNWRTVGAMYYLRTAWNAEVDVTDQVNYAITARRPLSFRVVSLADTGSTGYVEYYSRETSEQRRRPMLIIHE